MTDKRTTIKEVLEVPFLMAKADPLKKFSTFLDGSLIFNF
jgi:hypothetical protein